ncbi:hypothetical protein W97_02134 [Coniosporium apollinis CBS 100218]|uniref:[acyl-carrier-protein] S-malonyltransferase n=1 Tax=Coniosporium apollinis (strain CBS 100218) TaxID=1168221 RepID=R7YM60_CONA1|nr:uncharacterized protein W97_02134 [Coniosporium apollinis CBS 100218]EON62909.1 hypothetical protein W97_02134 [Coniosporium apollinis CBS 100218]
MIKTSSRPLRLRAKHPSQQLPSLQLPHTPRQLRWYAQPKTRPPTAIFFPGQGVQRVGMIQPWLEAFPSTVKPILSEIDEIVKYPLTKVIAEGTNAELTATENAQPAIMATSIVILAVLEKDFGFKVDERVDYTLGHSLGEFAALVAGGYLQFADGLKLVRRRAEVMARVSHEASREIGGEVGMVALVASDETSMNTLIHDIHDFLGHGSAGSKQDSAHHVPPVEQVLIANINSKNQIVLSGSIEKIKDLLTHLRQFGGHDPRHVRLKSDSPFHSPLMKPAEDLMKKMLHTPGKDGKDIVTFPGTIPCVSNVTAVPFKSKEQLKDLLARQATATVRWWDSVRYLHQEQKVRRWIGIGPGKVGRNLVGKEVGMKGAGKGGGVWGVTDPKDIEEILRALEETEGAQIE